MRNVQAREEPCKKQNHGDAAPKGMRKLPELWPTALFRGFHASRARTPQAPSCAARLFSGLPRAFSRAFSCSVGECALRRPIGCKPRSSLRDALKCQTNARSRFQPAVPLAIACAALAGAPLPPDRAHEAAYKNAGRQAPPGALRYLYYIKRRVPPQPAQWQAETPSKRPFRDRHSHPHARNRACHPLRGHRR